jgi:uncharacterized protein with von Willebrand factor type A (vWA) domain
MPPAEIENAAASPRTTRRGLVGLARDVRLAGLAVGVDQTELLCNAVSWVDERSRRQVHDAARAVLVHRHDDLPVFEEVFDRFWPGEERRGGGQKAPRAPRHASPTARRPALVTYMAERAAAEAPSVDVSDRQRTWSAEERIQRRDFIDLTPDELREVERFLAAVEWRIAERRSRRRVPRRRGESLDLRRACAQAGRHGGQVLTLPRRSRKIKERPLVLIADISGSMELYSRVLMHFFHSVGQSLHDVESFVFSTRLTRVTQQLRSRSVERALHEVAAEVVDWAGGTRIGESLAAFNRRWSRSVLRRGAVVLVVSDGWDSGDVAVLERELRFLHDRCHRLLWLNPLLGSSSYEPRVSGMRAALPHVDDFLPVHNLRSLRSLAALLSRLPARRARRGSSDRLWSGARRLQSPGSS